MPGCSSASVSAETAKWRVTNGPPELNASSCAEKCGTVQEADYIARFVTSNSPEGVICSLRGRALLQQASELRPQVGIGGIDGCAVRLVDDLAAAVEDDDVGVVLCLV